MSRTLTSAICSYIRPQLTKWIRAVLRCQVLVGSGTRSPELFEVFLCSLELAVGQLKYSNSQNANTAWNKNRIKCQHVPIKMDELKGKKHSWHSSHFCFFFKLNQLCIHFLLCMRISILLAFSTAILKRDVFCLTIEQATKIIPHLSMDIQVLIR